MHCKNCSNQRQALFSRCCKVSAERETSPGHVTPPQELCRRRLGSRRTGLKGKNKHNHECNISSTLNIHIQLIALDAFSSRHANANDDDDDDEAESDLRSVHACTVRHYCVIITANSIKPEHALKACRVASFQEADVDLNSTAFINSTVRPCFFFFFWQQLVWHEVRKLWSQNTNLTSWFVQTTLKDHHAL